MVRRSVGAAAPAGTWRKPVSLLGLVLGLLLAQTGAGAFGWNAQGGLTFFKNYFVTGDYVVGGTSLWRKGKPDGTAEGEIAIGGVPAGADILAALLYVQTGEQEQGSGIAGATFRGVSLDVGDQSMAKALNYEANTGTCWSPPGLGWRRLVTYRLDVLRLLDVDENGKFVVNGAHSIEVPDAIRPHVRRGRSGGWAGDDDDDNEEDPELPGEIGPRAVGASLIIVYKDLTKPLTGIVIYDGGFTKRTLQTMDLKMEGWYQALGGPGRVTHIVGDGQRIRERVRHNGHQMVNPFVGAQGRRWDNPTFNVPLSANEDVVDVEVGRYGVLGDCLSWSAIVLSTPVKDGDHDGLVDKWESSQWSGQLTDPYGLPLPDLYDMGARPNQRDLFVEVGWMETDPATSPDGAAGVTYGLDLKPHHTHRPKEPAIKKVGDAFWCAGRVPCDPSTDPLGDGIHVHFDLGDGYPAFTEPYAERYLVRGAGLARGGETVDEMLTVSTCPDPDDPDNPGVTPCQFPGWPGTVGWKSGFRSIRDALISDPEPDKAPEDDHICDSPFNTGYNEGPGGNCERVFDRNRKDMFRYLYSPHLLGVPKDHCLILDEFNPNFGLPDLACQMGINFHTPNTYTGIGDYGGGDFMLSMGGFDDEDDLPIGTADQQAGTIMHELGHTLLLSHGGFSGSSNCKPNYLSVMNYLFQLRQLKALLGGDAVIDFSGQTIAHLNESDLDETAGLSGLINDPFGAPPYRTAWYANTGGVTATRHCDGSEILAGEVALSRVEGTDVAGAIDWDGNGSADNMSAAGDVNFDGIVNDDVDGAVLAGYNDWANLRLDQVGSRRNIGVWFLADDFPYIGPSSLDMGRFDFGRFDFGRFDFGRFDFGRFDFGRFDFGRFDFGDINLGDLGRFDFGRFDFGRFDFGRFDFGVGSGNLGRFDFGQGGFLDFFIDYVQNPQEITYDLAVATGALGPPTGLTACWAEESATSNGYECSGDVTVPGEGLRVLVTWEDPGSSEAFQVYRVEEVEEEEIVTLVGTVEPFEGELPTTFVDFSASYATSYSYYVTVVREDGEGDLVESGPSDPVDLVTPDLPGLAWVPTTTCSGGETPVISFAGNAVVMGEELGDTSQTNCIHGVSVELPDLAGGTTRYQVTFTYSLFSWDAYNAPGTGGFADTGYWDSFSVSVSNGVSYEGLGLSDPVTTGNLPGLGFVWGGDRFGDSTLECYPSSGSCTAAIPAGHETVTVPGNLSGTSYLNVVLDTFTQPESNHAHPSWGTITILNIARVP